MAALPLAVFTYATGPYEEWHRFAWATALVLILVVFVLLSVAARFATRQRFVRPVAEVAPPVSRPTSSRAMYGKFTAVKGVSLRFPPNQVHALIGPSGCGKSTFLRTLNRMHELSEGGWITGRVLLDGEDIYAAGVNPMQLRRRVGMVFQKPTPFPMMSIYDNVGGGLLRRWPARPRRRAGRDRWSSALRRAALWDEVKDRLARQRDGALGRPAAAALHRAHHRPGARGHPARRADGGARPAGTQRIEELVFELKRDYHHRHRHAQHAAGGAGLRHHDLLLPGHHDRARADPADLHRADATSRPRPTSRDGSDDRAPSTPPSTSPACAPARGPAGSRRSPWTRRIPSSRRAASASPTGRQVLRDIDLPIAPRPSRPSSGRPGAASRRSSARSTG